MVKKTRNSNQWTEARYHGFIKSGLRSLSRKWPPKYETLNEACVGKKINKSSGRLAKHYKCADCGGEFPAKEVQVDHIIPIVPFDGHDSWDNLIERLFCEKEFLQVLCTTCHDKKTAQERAARRKS